jgi:hypothetical protein
MRFPLISPILTNPSVRPAAHSVARTPADTCAPRTRACARTHADTGTGSRAHAHRRSRARAAEPFETLPLKPPPCACAGHRRALGGNRGRAGAARGVAQHAGARMRGCAALWHAHRACYGYLLPHLHRGWSRPCHICTGTGFTPATSAPGNWGSPRPQLWYDCTHSQRAPRRSHARPRRLDEPRRRLSGNARLRRCHHCALRALRSRRAAQALHDEPDLRLVDEPQSDASPADHRRRR